MLTVAPEQPECLVKYCYVIKDPRPQQFTTTFYDVNFVGKFLVSLINTLVLFLDPEDGTHKDVSKIR